MRSSKLFATLSVLVLMILTTATAGAQSLARPGTWTVTPFVSGSIVTGEASNSVGVGGAVGYDWTSNVGFEGEFAHLFDVAGDSPSIDWRVTNLSANVLYHFDVRRVTPYATFGLGLERSHISLPGDDDLGDQSSNEVAVNFGGGVKYPATNRLLLRGDLRYFGATDLAPDFWRFYAGVTIRLPR